MSREPDIFDFWSIMKVGQKEHPSDKAVLDRNNHSLDLRCLPSPFAGPLRRASTVLLYLNPGLDEQDVEDAETPIGQQRCLDQLKGESFFPNAEQHRAAYTWLSSHTKLLGSWDVVQQSTAILELCPYRSKEFKDWHLLAALPSARRCLDWAQSVLFEEAIAGTRTVICMRSPGYWGLKQNSKYGKSLFAPGTNRSGYILNSSKNEILNHLTSKQ